MLLAAKQTYFTNMFPCSFVDCSDIRQHSNVFSGESELMMVLLISFVLDVSTLIYMVS